MSESSNIQTNAGKPKRATPESVEMHSIPDQIAADRYAQSVKRTRKGKSPLAGLRTRMRPPGGPGE